MNTTNAIQVLLVEDDTDLRSSLAEYLDLNGCAVTAVGTGMAFYQEIAKGCVFHVAVIDLGLPDQPGHVLAEYARRNTRMSIIIVTANDSLENRIETYRTGADVHLGKPLDSRELLAAVVAMERRYQERYGTQPAALDGTGTAWQLDQARRLLLAPGGATIALSPQETATCALFCAAGNGTVERRQLLERIYGRDDESAQRSLDNMISRLRLKISEGSSQSAPILTTYGIGYSFSEALQQV